MNKEQAYTEAVAADRYVCNQHSFNVGWDAAIAELAKVSEPVGYTNETEIAYLKMQPDRTMDVWGTLEEDSDIPVYTHLPFPMPDLVAENERLKVENSKLKTLPMKYRRMEFNAQLQKEADELRQQLSAAQVSEAELLKALEELACLGNGDCYGNSHGNVIAQEAIAAYKARQAKCDPTLTLCPRCNNDIFKCDGAYKARQQGKEQL